MHGFGLGEYNLNIVIDPGETKKIEFIADKPGRVIGRKTTTRWSRANRGNYWSEYDGYDLDADGIGDIPHRIRNLYERLEGDYPRLRIYFHSPAAQALAAAEPYFRSCARLTSRTLVL